ncbi:hypothetical protein QFC24_001381 [Naganishia onofrii]|uniref:Uncharacterized protein n=1 Tax=Naganishia onofrii TaxID=1851511 RepID=A0ACC2XUK2_9TREE|nr:hypothetical protein QFC24_001381 [Naganishia onofrii]
MEASYVEDRTATLPVGRPALQQRSKSRFVIDDLFITCSRTLFSPTFALLVPVTTAIYLNRISITDVWKQYLQGQIRLSWNSFDAVRQLASDWRFLSYAHDQGVGLFSRPKPLVWTEQVVIVTGGSSGVGRSIADKAAERGAKVVILDVTKPQEESKALQANFDPEDLLSTIRTFGVNTISHFWILQALLPGLIAAGKGHVVSVASLLGITGTAQLTDYCASKAAVIALHESLTYELRKHYHTPDIRTTLVIPSHIKTPMFSEIHFPKWGGLFPFLAPTLEPMDVADAIIGRLDKRENGTLRLPLYSHLGRVLGLAAEIIPGWARDLARWAAQSDASMRRYGGRTE